MKEKMNRFQRLSEKNRCILSAINTEWDSEKVYDFICNAADPIGQGFW